MQGNIMQTQIEDNERINVVQLRKRSFKDPITLEEVII